MYMYTCTVYIIIYYYIILYNTVKYYIMLYITIQYYIQIYNGLQIVYDGELVTHTPWSKGWCVCWSLRWCGGWCKNHGTQWYLNHLKSEGFSSHVWGHRKVIGWSTAEETSIFVVKGCKNHAFLLFKFPAGVLVALQSLGLRLVRHMQSIQKPE